MRVDNFLTQLFKIYSNKYSFNYKNLENVTELELISFAYGIFLILQVLKIDPDKIKVADRTLKDELDDIIKGYLQETNKDYVVTEEDKINDSVHGKDNVGFREYVPSGDR